MNGKRWKEIAETLADDEEVYVAFFDKTEADELIQTSEDTDDVFTLNEWIRITDKLDNDNYLNHVIWETFVEKVYEVREERKGNGNNQRVS